MDLQEPTIFQNWQLFPQSLALTMTPAEGPKLT